MVGDKKLDVEFGINAKIKTALVLTGYGQEHIKDLTQQPNVIADNLMEAVKAILSNQAE